MKQTCVTPFSRLGRELSGYHSIKIQEETQMKAIKILDKVYYITVDNMVFSDREEAIEHLRDLREA